MPLPAKKAPRGILTVMAVRHRASILFFAATSATDAPLRNQGLAANPAFAAAFAAAVGRDPELANDPKKPMIQRLEPKFAIVNALWFTQP